MSNQQVISRRYATGIELRGEGEKAGRTIRAYAALFNSTYDMGLFTEEIERSAFDAADMSDVRILKNHDPNLILGRNVAGTARTGVDDRGFWYEVDLPESPEGENVRVAIQRGDITQSSWGFFIASDPDAITWERRTGKKPHAKIKKVTRVFDASLVTFPANPDTFIEQSLRSLQAAQSVDIPTDEPKTDFNFEIRKRRLALAQTRFNL